MLVMGLGAHQSRERTQFLRDGGQEVIQRDDAHESPRGIDEGRPAYGPHVERLDCLGQLEVQR